MADRAFGENLPASSRWTPAAELVAVLDSAIALQPEIEAVMRACLAEGPKGAALARRASRITSTLVWLLDQVDVLPDSAITDEARGLLRYHHRLLAETVGFGYSVRAILAPRSARYFSAHLGEPAIRLRRLRDLLAGGRGENLPGGAAPAPGRSVLQSMVAESGRLARAVDNVLDLASIDSAALRPDFAWCNPAAILEAAVTGIQPGLAGQDRIDATLALPSPWAPGGLVWADCKLLSRAVANVIDNALRHGRQEGRVALAAGTERDQLTVSVTDEGPGLPAGVAEAISQAVTEGGLPTSMGTGIAATMGMVAAHGGAVSWSSSPRGTTCLIRLPLAGP